MTSPQPATESERIEALLEALRESEEFKTRLIDCSRDCLKVLDLDGRLLAMNAGGMEVLEICDLGPFLGSSWIDFWEGEDREKARAAVVTARNGGVGRFMGFFATRETHQPRWWDVVVSPILDANGKPDRILALSRDATDLKHAEMVLRQSRDDLDREVQERTASLAAANTALEHEIAERTRSEHTLRAIVEGVAAETGTRFFASLAENLAKALSVQYAFVSEILPQRAAFRSRAAWGRGALLGNFEVPLAGTPCEAVLRGETAHYPDALQERFPEDTGLVDWGVVSYFGVPLIDATGGVDGHIAVLDDKPMNDPQREIAILRIFAARAQAEVERLRSEEALRDSEERLSRILASAMDAIVTIDEEQRIVLFNAAAEKAFGCAATDAVGEPLDRFLTERFRHALARSLQTLSGDGQAQPYVWAPDGLTARNAAGREFPIEGTISRVGVGGRTLHTLILRNIDERRQAEDQLRHLNLHNQYLREEIHAVHNADEIVGQSRALRNVLEQARLVADTDSSVLILGETGTGKELIARAVHSRSRRKQRPLIKVNCAALPLGLIESELFGHERGAFTGASDRRIGRFELADGGTLFLDEVGDIPLDVQTKLLRVLQERELERIGGNKTIKVDVRLVAATNRDLIKAIAEGSFRQDLFYRLSVFPITLPPLRDRREDIPALVHYFVERFTNKIGRRLARVPDDAMQRLVAYSWPGNVRELENIIERAVILSPGPDLHVPPDLVSEGAQQPSPPPHVIRSPVIDATALEDVERDHIISTLKQVSWRIEGPDGAAHLLGLRPSTLRSRMKKLGIQRQ